MERADLVRVVEGVEDEPVLVWPDEDEVLLPVMRELGDADLPGFAHGDGEEMIRLLAVAVGSEVMDVAEVDRVDLGERHELLDFDRAIRFRLERLQLLLAEADVP